MIKEPELNNEVKQGIIQINSEVLRMKGTMTEDIKFIFTALQKHSRTHKQPSKLQLLFRASKHDFNASVFHEKCDKVNDTLVLVRTEPGKTLGGYSYYRWGEKEHMHNKQKNIVGTSTYVVDKGRRAFLLQLDLQQQLFPTKDDWLIQCDIKQGPIFGGSGDLFISNNCNIEVNSGCLVGRNYNLEGSKKYKYLSQESMKEMSGCTYDNGRFRVIEYEVFRVLWK